MSEGEKSGEEAVVMWVEASAEAEAGFHIVGGGGQGDIVLCWI